MAGSTTSCQPRASVADNTFAPSLPKKVLGAALGVVAAMPLLAPSPAQALTACASVTTTLALTDSCTIDDGGTTYEISLKTDTFANAFPSPSTTNMFWWNSYGDARDAMFAVDTAFGTTTNSGVSSQLVGPFFGFLQIRSGDIVAVAKNPLALTGSYLNAHSPNVVYTWATSSVYAPSASVPGPLPILGLAAAFGFSRKLRKRIKLHRGTSAVSTSPGA